MNLPKLSPVNTVPAQFVPGPLELAQYSPRDRMAYLHAELDQLAISIEDIASIYADLRTRKAAIVAELMLLENGEKAMGAT